MLHSTRRRRPSALDPRRRITSRRRPVHGRQLDQATRTPRWPRPPAATRAVELPRHRVFSGGVARPVAHLIGAGGKRDGRAFNPVRRLAGGRWAELVVARLGGRVGKYVDRFCCSPEGGLLTRGQRVNCGHCLFWPGGPEWVNFGHWVEGVLVVC